MILGSNLDAAKKEIQNAVIQNLASAPVSPIAGQVYYDTTQGKFGVYQAGSWVYLAAAGAANVSKASNASAAGVMQVSGGADKTIADFTSAGGIVKVSAAGVVSLAAPGTDYVTAASTNAFTNKTLDAAGTGNSLTFLATANFAVNVIDTDTALTANSDTRLASQKAVKAYIDAVSASEMTFKGGIDASASPNFPAAVVGDVYRITVAGLIGGASGIAVTVGDTIISAGTSIAGTQAAVGANWTVLQANVDAATSSTQGLTTYATAAEAEAKALSTKAVTPVALANFSVKKIATIGDGTTAAIVVTDNLNTVDKIAVVRDATTNAQILVDITYAANTTTITFASAPASNSYKVVIIG